MANDCFYFKNLDIIGMLDDMESDFVKELQKLVEKHGGKLWKNTKKKTPKGQYNDGRTGGTLRRSWTLEKGDLYVRLYNNIEYGIYVEYGHRTRQGKGHSNPSKKYKYKPKPNGIAYIEGFYMLTKSFEKTEKDFENDLEKLFKKYGFK